ncbi:MAG TPA: hypothetical protein VM056_05265 [Terriglobales bacterium]|nr:hypothetical protein [Terriglobales bacterium]
MKAFASAFAFRSTIILCLVLSMLLGTISATTVVPMSVERLTQASTHVVVAEVQESWTEWNADRSLIYTVTRLQVQKSLKGEAASTILVKQMGGSNGGYQQKVAGVRHFASGEKTVLFLHSSEANDRRMVVTGLMQGNFHVARSQSADPIVSNGVAGVEEFDTETRTVRQYSGSRMRLSELTSRVQKAGSL